MKTPQLAVCLLLISQRGFCIEPCVSDVTHVQTFDECLNGECTGTKSEVFSSWTTNQVRCIRISNTTELRVKLISSELICDRYETYHTMDMSIVNYHKWYCPETGHCTVECPVVNEEIVRTKVEALSHLSSSRVLNNYCRRTKVGWTTRCWDQWGLSCSYGASVAEYDPLGSTYLVTVCRRWTPKVTVAAQVYHLFEDEGKTVARNVMRAKKVSDGAEFEMLGYLFKIKNTLIRSWQTGKIGALTDLKTLKSYWVEVSQRLYPMANQIGWYQMYGDGEREEAMAKDLCACLGDVWDPQCSCRTVKPRDLIGVDSLMPLSFGGSTVDYNAEKKELSLIHDEMAGLVMNIRPITKTSSRMNSTVVLSFQVSGCYDCTSGFVIRILCSAKSRMVLNLNCEMTGTRTIVCGPRSLETNITAAYVASSSSVNFIAAESGDRMLHERCFYFLGGSTHEVIMSGVLKAPDPVIHHGHHDIIDEDQGLGTGPVDLGLGASIQGFWGTLQGWVSGYLIHLGLGALALILLVTVVAFIYFKGGSILTLANTRGSANLKKAISPSTWSLFRRRAMKEFEMTEIEPTQPEIEVAERVEPILENSGLLEDECHVRLNHSPAAKKRSNVRSNRNLHQSVLVELDRSSYNPTVVSVGDPKELEIESTIDRVRRLLNKRERY